MRKVVWTPGALEDLRQIREYIARDSVFYAEKVANGAFKAVRRLKTFPESGRMVPKFDDPKVREVIYGSYRILYRLIDEENVYIVAMVHARRQLPEALL